MTDEELTARAKGLVGALIRDADIIPGDEAYVVEALRIITEEVRRDALQDAAERVCILCHTGAALHYTEGWPLPFHKVKGRERKCAAKLIHNIKPRP